jgi:hypothetical protein
MKRGAEIVPIDDAIKSEIGGQIAITRTNSGRETSRCYVLSEPGAIRWMTERLSTTSEDSMQFH